MTTRINGGILSDQMLKGKFRYFKMTATDPVFLYTTGTASGVIVPDNYLNGDGDPSSRLDFKVYENQPVPDSAAVKCFNIISQRCTIAQINVISSNVIHFAIENNTNGWDITTEGSDLTSGADVAMTTAINDLGTVTVWDESDDGYAVNMETITVTEVEFQLV